MNSLTEYLKFRLRAVNVPNTIPHKSRAEEIAELPQYLEVATMVAPDLALINVGADEPSADRSAFPWLKLNSGGEPLGLYVNVGGVWEPSQSKYFPREMTGDILLQRAEQTVSYDVASGTAKTFTDRIEFDEKYDDLPLVRISVIGGTIIDEDNGYKTHIYPIDISTDGFAIKIFSNYNGTGTGGAKTVKFLWEAIGKKGDL